MNEYFSQCHLLLFLSTRIGKNPPLERGIPEDGKIAGLIKDIPASMSFIENTETGDQPDESSSSETAQLINSSFRAAFEAGHRKVAGIFSLPCGLTTELVREALLSLKPLDFCLGPDTDGGIWLLGMNRYEPVVITEMPWHGKNLAKTITRIIGQEKKIMYRLPYL